MNSSLELLNIIRKKREGLSKGQKKIADYVLNNYEKAAFLTALELGNEAGVSESTVVRFASALGLSGYPEFQRKLAGMVQEKIHSIERIEVAGGAMPRDQVLNNVLKADSSKILLTLESILNARHVYIIGLRSCGPLA